MPLLLTSFSFALRCPRFVLSFSFLSFPFLAFAFFSLSLSLKCSPLALSGFPPREFRAVCRKTLSSSLGFPGSFLCLAQGGRQGLLGRREIV